MNPETIQTTLDQRGNEYGDYSDMADLAQRLKEVMKHTPKWETLSMVQRESLEMLATKLARILTGNPNNRDSWHDIAGYVTLVERQLGS